MESVPYPSIQRFPIYLEVIKKMQLEGVATVSATDIAKELGLTNIQVRKDIGYTGIIGRPKTGYDINELIDVITTFLGWNNTHDAFLVGAGALGSALLGYSGFKEYGLNIIAAFDINPDLIGTSLHGKKILNLNKLKNYVSRMKVSIGILTVPQQAAQETADLMVEAGIRGLWNFASETLKVPEHIVVQRENLSASLALLSVKLAQKLK